MIIQGLPGRARESEIEDQRIQEAFGLSSLLALVVMCCKINNFDEFGRCCSKQVHDAKPSFLVRSA